MATDTNFTGVWENVEEDLMGIEEKARQASYILADILTFVKDICKILDKASLLDNMPYTRDTEVDVRQSLSLLEWLVYDFRKYVAQEFNRAVERYKE